VTASRGVPGARADRRAEGRRDDPDDDRASAEGQLAGEDAKLRAMRSVWLAMRDEEPSDGGLAELMAAARGKAAAMTPHPGLWARVVAALRRPPVFAFATVLVLLGGAMVVGHHVERTGAPVATGAQDEARSSADVERFKAQAGDAVGGDGVREDDVMQPAHPAGAPVVAATRAGGRAAVGDRALSADLVEGETSDAAASARDDGSRSPTANMAPDASVTRAAPARLPLGLDERAGEQASAPRGAVPSAPSAAAPSAPSAAAPSAPRTEAPSAPRAAAPSVPRPAVPSAPGAAVPSAPGAAAPSAPRAAVPSAPRAAAPSVPRAAAPSVPRVAVPSAPGPAAPSVPRTAAPSVAPETAGVVGLGGYGGRAGGAATASPDATDGTREEPRPAGIEPQAVTVTAPEGDPARVDRKALATRPQERSGAAPAALYRQCEAAATRGDCVEVRRLVKEISATDRGYRKRIADDARRVKRSGIASCLAE
jgi:hypothetical protein